MRKFLLSALSVVATLLVMNSCLYGDSSIWNAVNNVTDRVEEWQKWDLSELGAVAKVQFNFLYSEQMGGRYGFTIPGYFAYDDIAVRFED